MQQILLSGIYHHSSRHKVTLCEQCHCILALATSYPANRNHLCLVALGLHSNAQSVVMLIYSPAMALNEER